MLLVAWIFLITFGLIAVSQLLRFFTSSINIPSAILMFLSIIITGLSAGVIWGGLFSGAL